MCIATTTASVVLCEAGALLVPAGGDITTSSETIMAAVIEMKIKRVVSKSIPNENRLPIFCGIETRSNEAGVVERKDVISQSCPYQSVTLHSFRDCKKVQCWVLGPSTALANELRFVRELFRYFVRKSETRHSRFPREVHYQPTSSKKIT